MKRLRRVTKLPIAVGFGISSAEQFAEVGKFADAVVVGSAIVQTVERTAGKKRKLWQNLRDGLGRRWLGPVSSRVKRSELLPRFGMRAGLGTTRRADSWI